MTCDARSDYGGAVSPLLFSSIHTPEKFDLAVAAVVVFSSQGGTNARQGTNCQLMVEDGLASQGKVLIQ